MRGPDKADIKDVAMSGSPSPVRIMEQKIRRLSPSKRKADVKFVKDVTVGSLAPRRTTKRDRGERDT